MIEGFAIESEFFIQMSRIEAKSEFLSEMSRIGHGNRPRQ
jgi:hypothetical protein